MLHFTYCMTEYDTHNDVYRQSNIVRYMIYNAPTKIVYKDSTLYAAIEINELIETLLFGLMNQISQQYHSQF